MSDSQQQCENYIEYMDNLRSMTRSDSLPYMQRLTSGLLLWRVGRWHEQECVKKSPRYRYREKK
jgi:hypothetical protein